MAERDTAGEPPNPDQARPAAPAPDDAECQALLAHVVEVANDEHRRTVAPEHAPTPEQLADIRARMAPEFLPMCAQLERADYECQMRAKSRDALVACLPE